MNFVFLVTGVCVLGVAGLELELVELAWSVRLCFCCVRGASVSVVEAGGSLDGLSLWEAIALSTVRQGSHPSSVPLLASPPLI